VHARRELVGNRLALVGAVLYLLEWVAIAFIAELPTDRLGDGEAEIAAAYAGEAGAVALAAGWFSFVLLGRVLFVAAVRRSFHDSGRSSTLLDLALGAMIVSVAVEIVSLAMPAAAAWIAENGGDEAAIVALDAAGSAAFLMVFAPIGVAVAAIAATMLATRLFRAWVGWLGVAAGVLLIVGGVLALRALGDDGDFKELGQQPSAVGALAFWVWMLVTSIILWRRTPRVLVH
jgi:hypothetical protein